MTRGAVVVDGVLLVDPSNNYFWYTIDNRADFHGGVSSWFWENTDETFHYWLEGNSWKWAVENFNVNGPQGAWELSVGDVDDDGKMEWRAEQDVPLAEMIAASPKYGWRVFGAVPPLISDHYTQDSVYVGQESYHSHHGAAMNAPVEDNKLYRIGVELEIEARGAQELRWIKKIRSNWFYQERDGSLGTYGDELITIPLLPKDAKDPEFWRPLVKALSGRATSWDKPSTGLHVHIGREILGNTAEAASATLGKLLYFYHHLIGEDDQAKAVNEKVYGRAHTYNEHDGKTREGLAVKVLGRDVLKVPAVADKVGKGMIDKASETRYFDINLLNSATVEFRKGKGSISAERITAVVAWSEGMVDYCRKTAWADLDFRSFVEWIRARRGTPVSLKGMLTVDE